MMRTRNKSYLRTVNKEYLLLRTVNGECSQNSEREIICNENSEREIRKRQERCTGIPLTPPPPPHINISVQFTYAQTTHSCPCTVHVARHICTKRGIGKINILYPTFIWQHIIESCWWVELQYSYYTTGRGTVWGLNLVKRSTEVSLAPFSRSWIPSLMIPLLIRFVYE